MLFVVLLASSVFALKVSAEERFDLLASHVKERLDKFYSMNGSFEEGGAGLRNYFKYEIIKDYSRVFVYNTLYELPERYSTSMVINGTMVEFAWMNPAFNYGSNAQFFCKPNDFTEYPVRFEGPINYSRFDAVRKELVYACLDYQKEYNALLAASPTPSPVPTPSTAPSVSPVTPSPSAAVSATPSTMPSTTVTPPPSPSAQSTVTPSASPLPEFAPSWDPKIFLLIIGMGLLVAMLYLIGKAITH